MMYKPSTLGEGSGQVTGLAVSLGNAMKIRCALVGIATYHRVGATAEACYNRWLRC